MFHFPEPEPLDYYIDDVSPSFLTDGVLLRGKLEPVHKCVGKQLRPIKRKPSDPVGPIRKVDSSTLERWMNKEKAGFANKCEESGWTIQDMMNLFPRRKFDSRRSQNSKLTIFPRSKRYEYEYTSNERMRNSELENDEKFKCIPIDECPSAVKTPEKNKCTMHPLDYKEDAFDIGDEQIRKKIQVKDKELSVSDAMITSEYPSENKTRDGLHRADATKVDIREEINAGSVAYAGKQFPCKHGKTLLCYAKIDGVPNANEAETMGKDSRWRSLRSVIDAPRDEIERREEMSKVSKPYLHELNKWYSENKPSKIFPRVRVTNN